MKDGFDVRGFFYWTLIDNFEWNFAWVRPSLRKLRPVCTTIQPGRHAGIRVVGCYDPITVCCQAASNVLAVHVILCCPLVTHMRS